MANNDFQHRLLHQIRANSKVPGAIAIFPFSSKMAFPSKVTAGSILCSNMITLDLSRLKYLCFTKNSSVGLSVNSLVMMYLVGAGAEQGTRKRKNYRWDMEGRKPQDVK